MALPGYDWLSEHLAGLREHSGDFEAGMRHPVQAGAAWAVGALFIIVWLLALGPMLLWTAGRRMLAR